MEVNKTLKTGTDRPHHIEVYGRRVLEYREEKYLNDEEYNKLLADIQSDSGSIVLGILGDTREYGDVTESEYSIEDLDHECFLL